MRGRWTPASYSSSAVTVLVFFLALQELLVFLHLSPFLRTLWIETLHFKFLFSRKLGEVADEADQVPARALALLAAVAPARHPSEAHAVFDDVEQLAVRQLLGLRQPQVGRSRIEVAPHLRLAAPVVRMADGAVVREVASTSRDRFLRRGHRVTRLSLRIGNAEAPQPARDDGL